MLATHPLQQLEWPHLKRTWRGASSQIMQKRRGQVAEQVAAAELPNDGDHLPFEAPWLERDRALVELDRLRAVADAGRVFGFLSELLGIHGAVVMS